MIVRYNASYDDIVLYYYDSEGRLVQEYLDDGTKDYGPYKTLADVRSVWKHAVYSPIIHDDGEP
jgi:hypothetical protein